MKILRLEAAIEEKKLQRELDRLDALAIRADAVESLEELELSEHLAREAFERKRNIARKPKYEFLLWLAAKTDIKSAMEATWPGKPETLHGRNNRGDRSAPTEQCEGSERTERCEFLLVLFSDAKPDAVCRMLDAHELPLGLKKSGDPLRLERISLSRIS